MQAWVNSVQMMAVTPETVGGCQSGVGKNYFFNYNRSLALSQVSVQLEPLRLQLLVVLLVCEVAAAANIGEGVVEKVLEPVVLGPWIGGLRPLLPLIVCRYVLAL